MMDPTVYIVVGIAQVASILGGGGIVAYRIGRSTARVETAIEVQKQLSIQNGSAIDALKAEVAALKTLLTEVALQKAAIERLEKWYDELRRGEGFVYPLGTRLQKATQRE